ncbi:uncharacterized protein LOC130049500 [Ostrea edulis]|uniref:uncharacterized protein LOC130049500 n=1 Tax=Ostrea edulis TaxID=37623 RepID=UPI0024AE91C0|nr:uncharacterized protein LOC130049500 [Ostrea edulis]
MQMGEELEKEASSQPQVVTVTPNTSFRASFNSSCTSDKLISLEPSSPKYSPAIDENWPPSLNQDGNWLPAPVIDQETGEKSFSDVEDSILTTFRRKNPTKFKALEKKMRTPLKENVQEQFNLLRNIHRRIAEDIEQSSIIINYLEDKCSTEPAKKRAKLTTL